MPKRCEAELSRCLPHPGLSPKPKFADRDNSTIKTEKTLLDWNLVDLHREERNQNLESHRGRPKEREALAAIQELWGAIWPKNDHRPPSAAINGTVAG